MKWIRWFLADYGSRHQNPWSRLLHVIGVPIAPFLFLYLLVRGQFAAAGIAFAVGYGLQWLGHRIEGNELGEWILIKSIWRRLTLRGNRKARSEP